MVVCTQLAPLSDQKKVCCVIDYNFQGEKVGNSSCVIIGAGFSEADCTRNFNFDLVGGGSVSVPYGTVAECCRDCFPPEKKLVVSGGRLVRNGTSFTMSPSEEPEKCCCGDECTCKEVPDCTQVRCYGTKSPTTTDKCKGRCVIKTYDINNEEIIDDRQIICATITQCCAEDDTTCEATCKDGELLPGGTGVTTTVPPANDWAAMPCTNCSVCCEYTYDEDPTSPTFRKVLSKTGRTDIPEDECKANRYLMLDPTNPLGARGLWHNGTDNVNICNPLCCQELTRGDEKEVRCASTSATTCDPCLGRCIEVEYENNPAKCPRATCATKQDCCGDGGEKCQPQCGATKAQYRWEESCGDGTKCGTCCQFVYDSSGISTSKTCDADTKTKAECERLIGDWLDSAGNPLPQAPYGVWHPFETCVVCNPTPCCREITCPDGKKSTTCVNVAEKDCDACNGSCLELASGNSTCAHYRECCGENGEKCNSTCGVAATYTWTQGCANGEKCGACCRIVFDGPGANAKATDATCLSDVKNKADCKASETDDAILAGHVIKYVWKPFETCNTAKCDKKKCCGETCPDDVGCIDIDINDECDPCKGRCRNRQTNKATCKTKQECCDDDGLLCVGCTSLAIDSATFEWGGCFENGYKCGVCCELTLDDAGNPVDATCHDDLTYDQCKALPNGEWKAFETCASAICIPRSCCNDEICAEAICIAVDKKNGSCSDFCRGQCYDINEAGGDAGPAFCATKVDCCGELNENCAPQEGLCPDGGTNIPTRSWPNECADGELCGKCCKRNLNPDGSLASLSCDDTKDNRKDCEAGNFGIWHPFATCAACGNAKLKCIEVRCKKIVHVDGEDQEVTITNATCKQATDKKSNCKGVCTELATAARPYAVTTCKTKSECCGSDGAKCSGGGCGGVITHAFSNSCLDGEQCGVCCIVTDIGDGNPTPGPPDENIGRAACEAKGMGGGGDVGVTATWIPFGTAKDCLGKPCATLCPDNSVVCITITPPGVCPADTCAGKCVGSDGTVSVKTKADCCVQNGVNLCNAPANDRCPKPPTWTAVCDENATKCGAVCKTITNNGIILSSACDPTITTYKAMLLAQAAAPPGISYTWNPWETCDTLICRSKKCCKDICPDVKGCATVDYTDECKKCSGLCYDAIVTVDALGNSIYNIDPEGNVECLPRSECCGVGNEKCSAIPNCPQQSPKVFEPCGGADDCPNGDCRCGSPNYAANQFSFFSNTPEEPGSRVEIAEQCSSGFEGVGYNEARLALMQSIEDPCYNNCPPPNDPTDEEAYNNYELCIMREEAKITYPFDWKPCYPDILGNKQLYLYTEFCSWLRWDHGFNGQYYTDSTANAAGFYICDGEKLVNVTDTILTKNKIKLCQTSYFAVQNVTVNSERTNVEIDPFDWGQCIKYTIGKTDDNKPTFKSEYTLKPCMGTFKTVCDAYNPPKADIKDDKMINCPPAFTMNPLP